MGVALPPLFTLKVIGAMEPLVIAVEIGDSVKLTGAVSIIWIFLMYTFQETLIDVAVMYASSKR